MTTTVYLNGDWVASDQAKVSVFDRGFLFADGVYEVVPVYSSRPFHLERHLDRLRRSLDAIGISAPTDSFWQQMLHELLERNSFDDCLIYIQVTHGADLQRAHLPHQVLQPTIFAMVSPLRVHWDIPKPIATCVLNDIRWLHCDIKSISLLGNIMLKREAQARGIDEPMLQRDGYVTEGASSNFFAVKQGVIYTAPADHLILPGITRNLVVELAQDLGIKVVEEPFAVTALADLDEVFLTSSSREVQPVHKIDDIIIGNDNNAGECGPIAKQLAEAFHASKRHLIQE